MAKEGVKVNLMELMTMNEIRLKHNKLKLAIGDQYISLFKRISELSQETTLEELELMQNQLRAMMNQNEEDLKGIKDDKEFVDKLMKRAEENEMEDEK